MENDSSVITLKDEQIRGLESKVSELEQKIYEMEQIINNQKKENDLLQANLDFAMGKTVTSEFIGDKTPQEKLEEAARSEMESEHSKFI